MAQQAAEHLTPTYNWSLGEAFRHLTRAVRLPDHIALYEMEQLRVEVQKYVDGKPRGEPEYLFKSFRLRRDRHGVVMEGIPWDSRCKVAEQDVRAIQSASSAVQPSQEQSKPKAEGWQVRRVKKALKETFPPDGHPPVDMLVKTVREEVKPLFEARKWKLASLDSVARAMERRRA